MGCCFRTRLLGRGCDHFRTLDVRSSITAVFDHPPALERDSSLQDSGNMYFGPRSSEPWSESSEISIALGVTVFNAGTPEGPPRNR
jgi:hypothetical protein